jgi:hypothetical protein
MKTFTIPLDIPVLFVQAESFPDGIMDAFNTLRDQVPGSDARTVYGISRPENGVIIYKAAIEELFPGEAELVQVRSMVIPKGEYVCAIVKDFMHHIQEIGIRFRELLAFPGLDPDGSCVEWYFNETDVQCMIRLKNI